MSAQQLPLDNWQPPVVKHTEASLLAAVRTRYSQHHGNGERYVFATHVRSDGGFYAERTADAVVMDLWPSTGHEIHGFEVKVSRSDWRHEVEQPEKCEAVKRFCHRWWLVAPADVAEAAPLPKGWGLLVPSGPTLRLRKRAPLLKPEPMTPGFTAALLRAAIKAERRREQEGRS